MRNGTSVVAEVTVALQEVGPQLLEEFLARSEMKSDMHRIELQLMKQFDINTILDIPKVLKRIATTDASKSEKKIVALFEQKREELAENRKAVRDMQS